MLSWLAITMMSNIGKIPLLCEDENRLELKTISGRKITAKGVKPYAKVQCKFQATCIYGVVEPKTGEHLFYEFTHLNSQYFQNIFRIFSEYYADIIAIPIVVRYRVLGFEESGVRSQESGFGIQDSGFRS